MIWCVDIIVSKVMLKVVTITPQKRVCLNLSTDQKFGWYRADGYNRAIASVRNWFESSELRPKKQQTSVHC